jgi:hypothetical protein
VIVVGVFPMFEGYEEVTRNRAHGFEHPKFTHASALDLITHHGLAEGLEGIVWVLDPPQR